MQHALLLPTPPTQVHKSSLEESQDERRLLLRVAPDGTIQSTGDSPTSLFGVDPASLKGHNVSEMVDMLGEWSKAGELPSGSIHVHSMSAWHGLRMHLLCNLPC